MAPQRNAVIFGFDSAWADKDPGAICAITFDDHGEVQFEEPCLVSFDKAYRFIEKHRKDRALSLIAIDQPTKVPNPTGMRPVEKVAASLVSYVGGGVQPANRGKKSMFGDEAAIWPFLCKLAAKEDPVKARVSCTGHFLVEVFPALALPALKDDFAQRLSLPKYNPRNKKFCLGDWNAVVDLVKEEAEKYGVRKLAEWANQQRKLCQPRKRDQDMLDAALCALIGLACRRASPSSLAMLGDVNAGYMVTPVSDSTRPRLEKAAASKNVKFICPLR